MEISGLEYNCTWKNIVAVRGDGIIHFRSNNNFSNEMTLSTFTTSRCHETYVKIFELLTPELSNFICIKIVVHNASQDWKHILINKKHIKGKHSQIKTHFNGYLTNSFIELPLNNYYDIATFNSNVIGFCAFETSDFLNGLVSTKKVPNIVNLVTELGNGKWITEELKNKLLKGPADDRLNKNTVELLGSIKDIMQFRNKSPKMCQECRDQIKEHEEKCGQAEEFLKEGFLRIFEFITEEDKGKLRQQINTGIERRKEEINKNKEKIKEIDEDLKKIDDFIEGIKELISVEPFEKIDCTF